MYVYIHIYIYIICMFLYGDIFYIICPYVDIYGHICPYMNIYGHIHGHSLHDGKAIVLLQNLCFTNTIGSASCHRPIYRPYIWPYMADLSFLFWSYCGHISSNFFIGVSEARDGGRAGRRAGPRSHQ